MSESKVYQNEKRQEALYEYAKTLPCNDELIAKMSEFNEEQCDPPLDEDEMVKVLRQIVEEQEAKQKEWDALARFSRFQMVRIGSRYYALDTAALKQGEVVAYNHPHWMEGAGNFTYTTYATETTTRIDNRSRKPITVKTMKATAHHAGREWWDSRCEEEPRRIAFRPGEEKDRPGEVNTWAGWGVKPSPDGSCVRFRLYLLDVLCRGNTEHYQFLWDWLCSIFQEPQARHGVAVALRGKQGTGRSLLGAEVHHGEAQASLLPFQTTYCQT